MDRYDEMGAQKARSPVVDAYFIIMSFLGDQILYVCFLPWFLWVLDPSFGRLFLLLLISGTFLAKFPKNRLFYASSNSKCWWLRMKNQVLRWVIALRMSLRYLDPPRRRYGRIIAMKILVCLARIRWIQSRCPYSFHIGYGRNCRLGIPTRYWWSVWSGTRQVCLCRECTWQHIPTWTPFLVSRSVCCTLCFGCGFIRASITF